MVSDRRSEEAICPLLGELARAGKDQWHLGVADSQPAKHVRQPGGTAPGLSSKQTDRARQFISERTVDSHVRIILNKLGFDSRAQVAGWFAGRVSPEDPVTRSGELNELEHPAGFLKCLRVELSVGIGR